MLLVLNSSGPVVSTWQTNLNKRGFKVPVTGIFDESTFEATKQFQTLHSLTPDGMVGNITWNYEESIDHPALNVIHTSTDVLQWIKTELSPFIVKGITVFEQHLPVITLTEDWLAGIACRETGGLITKYVNQGHYSSADIAGMMKGDYTNGMYHGYGFFQIDIRSFPDFIQSGDWKDPEKVSIQACNVLNQKGHSLLHLGIKNYTMYDNLFERAVTAAYNCGEGNVMNAIKDKEDIDARTANKNYSIQVFQFRSIYKTLE